MGSSQSQPPPDVIRIDRKDIPEEYTTVGVSSDVVRRVNSQQPGSAETDRLRDELIREREERVRLREEMTKLTELQQRKATDAPLPNVASDIDERKKVFDDTVERVQREFFQYHRENVCQENEQEIMSCLKSNPNRVLECSNLAQSFEKCVSDFRQQVLSGN